MNSKAIPPPPPPHFYCFPPPPLPPPPPSILLLISIFFLYLSERLFSPFLALLASLTLYITWLVEKQWKWGGRGWGGTTIKIRRRSRRRESNRNEEEEEKEKEKEESTNHHSFMVRGRHELASCSEQFQCLNVFFNNKTVKLFFQFSWCKDTF